MGTGKDEIDRRLDDLRERSTAMPPAHKRIVALTAIVTAILVFGAVVLLIGGEMRPEMLAGAAVSIAVYAFVRKALG